MSRARAARGLKFFFQAVTPDEARAALATFAALGTEQAPVAAAAGRVLAADVAAPGDLPHFDRANMDGYAVRAADTFGAATTLPAYLRLASTVAMGRPARRTLRKGEAFRISPGDYRLRRLGIRPDRITGYEREEDTHMAVAVASGLADAALGIRQAAAALGLDFVPLETEDYDLVLLRSFAESEMGDRLRGAVRSPQFAAAVGRLARYSSERTGTEKPLGRAAPATSPHPRHTRPRRARRPRR